MVNQKFNDILFFKSEADGNPRGHSYFSISDRKYKIRPGDILEYDIYIDLTCPVIKGGVDIHFKDAAPLRDSKIVDQNFNSSRPYTFLYDAAGVWFSRKMDLSNTAGNVIESVEIAIVAHLKGTYIVCFRDIKITRNGKIVHTIYKQGAPDIIKRKLLLGFKNDLIKAITWHEFPQLKLENINQYALSMEIQLAERLLSHHKNPPEDMKRLIDKAKSALDLDSYKAGRFKLFEKSLNEIRKILKPLLKNIKDFSTHYIGHAHIDMNWLWTWEETVAVAERDFETMIKLMKRFPFFKFSQSQAVLYETIMKLRPDIFEDIKRFVKKGQWEITASMWVEADENMASGEALVRQILLAKKFIRKHFDRDVRVCWQPDQFGHAATMPQILKKSGIDYYYFMRCAKENPSVFKWIAPGGSGVIAAATFNYNDTIEAHAQTIVLDLFESHGIKDYMHIYGVGDHGGGPTIRDIKRGIAFKKNKYIPSSYFSTVYNYFETIKKKYPYLKEIKDELQFIFEGCYTTHADIKKRNRICESLFPSLEIYSIFAMPYGLPYPKKILDDAWERTCFNQFHDILPGSAIHATYGEAVPVTDAVVRGGESAFRKALSAIAENIDTSGSEENALIVFNQLNWKRGGAVTFEMIIPAEETVEIYDGGKIIPSQITCRNSAAAELIFTAEDIPAMGYKTFGIRKIKLMPGENFSVPSEFTSLENDFFKISFDRKCGAVTGIFDKRLGREYLREGCAGNVFQILHEEGLEMSAWEIGKVLGTKALDEPVSFEFLERGPVRDTVQIIYKFNKSTFIQKIVLYNKLPRIDFPCVVDWQETGSRKDGSYFLKVYFPFKLPGRVRAKFEIPFGHISRKADGHEYPSQKWFSLSGKNSGIVFLNDSKYGCDVNGSDARLSLLRSSYEPDPFPDVGIHEFAYGLITGENISVASSVKAGYEFNNPLSAVMTSVHKGSLKDIHSFLSCSKPNVVVTAFKLCEYDKSLILRFYETAGRSTHAKFTIGFDIVSAEETDTMENSLPGRKFSVNRNSFTADLLPYEIKTVKIKRKNFSLPKHHDFQPVEF